MLPLCNERGGNGQRQEREEQEDTQNGKVHEVESHAGVNERLSIKLCEPVTRT